ncbi:MAG: leucine-rich repeat protein [Holosporales bacterium]
MNAKWYGWLFILMSLCVGHPVWGSGQVFLELPDDALKEVIRHVPLKTLGQMEITAKSKRNLIKKEVSTLVGEMTYNLHLRSAQQKLQGLPIPRIHLGLAPLMYQNCYVAVPLNSELCAFIPNTYKVTRREDLQQHLEALKPLYHAAFGNDLPQFHLHYAIDYLLAVLDIRLYVHRHQSQKGLANFFNQHAQGLLRTLIQKTDSRPFMNLLHDYDVNILQSKPHTIVVSDAELEDRDSKQLLEHILSRQPEHHLLFLVGRGPHVRESTLYTKMKCFDWEDSWYIPNNVKHLTLCDTDGHVKRIGDQFLTGHKKLTSLAFWGFQSVSVIGSHFLGACTSMTKLDISAMPLRQLGSHFLYECRAFETVDLEPLWRLTTLKGHFLEGCTGLTSVDFAPLQRVTTIGSYFMQGCKKLSFVDLRPLLNVDKIGDGFFEACSGLDDETKADIIDFCEDRGVDFFWMF